MTVIGSVLKHLLIPATTFPYIPTNTGPHRDHYCYHVQGARWVARSSRCQCPLCAACVGLGFTQGSATPQVDSQVSVILPLDYYYYHARLSADLLTFTPKEIAPMTTPAHLFISSTDGGLYDTRRSQWSTKAIRPVFTHTFASINTTQEFRATLRGGEYAWPGGYPMFLITSDGAALHFNCARENQRYISDSIRNKSNDGWRVIATEINYESTDLYCDHCSQPIDSAYGEDSHDS